MCRGLKEWGAELELTLQDDRSNKFQDHKCTWYSHSLVFVSVYFSFTAYNSVSVRVEKQDSCVGLG